MEVFPLGESRQASHSSACSFRPVDFRDELGSSPQGEFNFSFRTREEDKLLIAALKAWILLLEADDSPRPPPSGVMVQAEADAELTAVLARSLQILGSHGILHPVLSVRVWMISFWASVFSAFLPASAPGDLNVMEGTFHCQNTFRRFCLPHYTQWQGGQGVHRLSI